MSFSTCLLQLGDSSVFLLSPWKPLILWGVFIAWAWLVSTKIDKDLRYYKLGWQKWNTIFLGSGVLAVAALFTGWQFWVSLPAGFIILLTPVLCYWKIRNASVPEDKQYHLSFSKDAAVKQQQKLEKARQAAVLQFTDSRGQDVKVPGKEEPAFQVYLRAEDIIGPAIKTRASKIEMLLTNEGCHVAWMVDGFRTKQEGFNTEDGAQVINFMKQLAGMDLSDTRRKKSSSFSLTGPMGETTVQLTASGSSKGSIVILEFNRENARIVHYEQLGLLPQQREMIDSLMESHERHGIVLVTSPPNQGSTTTAYSLMARHDAYTSNIKSLEYEIEAYISGVDQVEWDPMNVDIDFATNLQSILRRDPDIALVGDVRDSDTAKSSIAPGRQGPLIYVTMHSSNIVSCIREWVKYVGDVDSAVKPIRAILSQRLIRKLCPNCRQPLTPEELASIKLPSGIGKELCRSVGQVQIRNKVTECPICNGTGFMGQTGVYEVLDIDKDIRNHLRGGDLKTAMATARRNRMLLMQEAALWKAGQGETSLDEVARVLSPGKSSEKKKKKATKAEAS
ncbi:MAG: ATPase, T2SS/T4P/T4SS family [Phycisphaerales bacterium]|nr:ATPase, T2SS/T4P/T4SS family [Phycisphaerales bacterium]